PPPPRDVPGRAPGLPVRPARRPGPVPWPVRGRAPSLWLLAGRLPVRSLLASRSPVGVAALCRRPVGVDPLRLDGGGVRAVGLGLPLRARGPCAALRLVVLPRLDVGTGLGTVEHLRRIRRVGAAVAVRGDTDQS